MEKFRRFVNCPHLASVQDTVSQNYLLVSCTGVGNA